MYRKMISILELYWAAYSHIKAKDGLLDNLQQYVTWCFNPESEVVLDILTQNENHGSFFLFDNTVTENPSFVLLVIHLSDMLASLNTTSLPIQ